MAKFWTYDGAARSFDTYAEAKAAWERDLPHSPGEIEEYEFDEPKPEYDWEQHTIDGLEGRLLGDPWIGTTHS